MSKVKQIKIQDKESIENFKEIGDIMDQLTGMHGKAEPEIVIPKIIEIYNYVIDYFRTLQMLLNTNIIQDVELYLYNNDIQNFILHGCAELEIDLAKKSFNFEFSEKQFYEAQLKNDTKYIENLQKQLFEKYKKLKESNTIKHIIATCGHLKNFETALLSTHSLDNIKISEQSRYHPKRMKKKETKPNWGFIEELSNFHPLSYAKCIDFKFLWIQSSITKSKRKLLVGVLFNLYIYGSMIFDIMTSPDIDTKKLSELFIEAISAAKKRLPGFEKAFKIIESATDLLDRKFNDYYRDSVRNNKNSMVFIEDFICDLADENTDAVSRAQLKKLAFKLKEMISQSPDYKNNPSVQTLVVLMDKAINQIDSN